MLTFFATLLVNILIGTIFYLFITLRLEKSASELQVKKMRREMDEMIREFNITAERNISLLENRIGVMKRLLEKNGIKSDIDVTINSKEISHSKNLSAGHKEPEDIVHLNKTDDSTINEGSLLKKLGNRIMNAIHETPAIKDNRVVSNVKTKTPYGESLDIRIDNISDIKGSKKNNEKRHLADMKTAFILAENRKDIYSLLSQYYDEGHSVEELSKVSGVPAGEISLVVSLNSRKG